MKRTSRFVQLYSTRDTRNPNRVTERAGRLPSFIQRSTSNTLSAPHPGAVAQPPIHAMQPRHASSSTRITRELSYYALPTSAPRWKNYVGSPCALPANRRDGSHCASTGGTLPHSPPLARPKHTPHQPPRQSLWFNVIVLLKVNLGSSISSSLNLRHFAACRGLYPPQRALPCY